MNESAIVAGAARLYGKFRLYLKNSVLYLILVKLSAFFKRLAEGSGILGFFNLEWGFDRLWTESAAFGIFTYPLRLCKAISKACSEISAGTIEGSTVLSFLDALFKNAFRLSTRVYGLLLAGFAVMEGILQLALQGGIVHLLYARLALAAVAIAFILLDRPLAALFKGSFVCGLTADYFTLPEVKNNGAGEEYGADFTFGGKSLEIAAVVIGTVLGVLGYLLPPVVFAVLAGGAATAAVILWRYEIGVYLSVALIPLSPTTPLLGLLALTTLSFAVRLFLKGELRLRITPLDVFVVLFAGVLVASTITSYTVKSSFLALLIHMIVIIFYFVLINTIKSKKQLWSMIALLVFTTAIAALYGLYQYKTGGTTSEAWVDTTMFEDIRSRVTSTFDNPNILGEYLVLILPLAAALLWEKKHWLVRLAVVFIAAVIAVCLIVTFSRGAYVGVVLAAVLFSVLRDKRMVLLGLVLLLLMPFVLPDSVINRFLSIGNLQDSSSSYRVSVWLGSLRIAGDYWPSGIGLGLQPFELIYPKYSLAAAYAHHSHNIYIELLLETGIVGFVLFACLVIVFYKYMLSGFWKTRDAFTSTLMIGISAGLAGYFAQGMAENLWYNNRVLLTFWVVVALGMAARKLVVRGSEVEL